MIPVKITLKSGAKLPEYQSKGAAGADIHAFLENPLIIKPGQTKLIPTGLSIELPHGYEAQIRPRSGLAINRLSPELLPAERSFSKLSRTGILTRARRSSTNTHLCWIKRSKRRSLEPTL